MAKKKNEAEALLNRFLKINIPTKDFQVDHMIQLKILIDGMMEKYMESKQINVSDFAKLSKNLVALTDKLRRQDEGIKINQDIYHSHVELKRIMDAQAENIKQLSPDEKLIELEDDRKANKKQDNRARQAEPGKEVADS